jgi:isoaspartyl peptidase/L-asparaginase-like protein (Ntn-hydrolase superfamily)
VPAVEPVIIASERGEIGLPEAMDLLRAGGSAMDAVELALRAAEANTDDHYVGVGGLPNLLGEVELDASIMDGTTLAAGAVAAVTGFPHPITIARAVCERLPQHLLLVGAGAERFAEECGIPRGTTLTGEAEALWRDGLAAEAIAEAGRVQGPGEAAYRRSVLERLQALPPPHDHPWGTINVIARDTAGRLCTGVSTSGYPWKYPGRVGDSAVIGAGNYCDGRYAGAACTGRGELTIRAGTARTVVEGVRAGSDPASACAEALAATLRIPDEYRAQVRALCLTADGRHGGAATVAGSTYALMTGDHGAPEILPRAVTAQQTGVETEGQP